MMYQRGALALLFHFETKKANPAGVRLKFICYSALFFPADYLIIITHIFAGDLVTPVR